MGINRTRSINNVRSANVLEIAKTAGGRQQQILLKNIWRVSVPHSEGACLSTPGVNRAMLGRDLLSRVRPTSL
jgi:hypothetical protein